MAWHVKLGAVAVDTGRPLLADPAYITGDAEGDLMALAVEPDVDPAALVEAFKAGGR